MKGRTGGRFRNRSHAVSLPGIDEEAVPNNNKASALWRKGAVKLTALLNFQQSEKGRKASINLINAAKKEEPVPVQTVKKRNSKHKIEPVPEMAKPAVQRRQSSIIPKADMPRRRVSTMIMKNASGNRRISTFAVNSTGEEADGVGEISSRASHRSSVFAVDQYGSARMSKRQSSVFLQAEFDKEMKKRQDESKSHVSISLSSEEKQRHEQEKAERFAKSNENLTHNERVKRIIAKWKMREIQGMFLAWRRYVSKQSKAREAEQQVAPYLEVLTKESWERDEKDVDLLFSFVQNIKFFQELEESMGRDLCKMFRLEEYL